MLLLQWRLPETQSIGSDNIVGSVLHLMRVVLQDLPQVLLERGQGLSL